MADERPVHVRTSASARDFWCRVRDDEEMSPDFRVGQRTTVMPPFETPFNRQVAPSGPVPRLQRPQPRLASSRSVERNALKLALQDAENIPPTNTRPARDSRPTNAIDTRAVISENEQLKKQLRTVRSHLERALRINHALTGAMVEQATDTA